MPMAAHATHSASSDEASLSLLLALSHDALGVIFDGLADPLQPVVAATLSSTCLGLRTPLLAALEVLEERHERAVALCRKLGGVSCAELADADELFDQEERWMLHPEKYPRLTVDDAATLGMILRTNGLPRLLDLHVDDNRFGDAGIQAFCDGLVRGSAPLLRKFFVDRNQFGPSGAVALAAALRRGAMPKIQTIDLSTNPVGNEGVTVLAPLLRTLPALKRLNLMGCEIGDEAVASLVDDLGKDDFKKLDALFLQCNNITDAGCAKLTRALTAGALPELGTLLLSQNNSLTDSAYRALRQARPRLYLGSMYG